MTRSKAAQPRLSGFGGLRPVARNKRAWDAQVAAQRALGQIEPVDVALVALGRTLAENLDAEHCSPDVSRHTVAMLAGRYLPVLLELRGSHHVRADDHVDHELAALVAALRDSTRPAPGDPP